MAADTLRERIARAVGANVTNADGFPLVSYDDATRIINTILPLVEQAIQQEREKWMAIVREVQDECDALLKTERLSAAADAVRSMVPLLAQSEQREREKDAQIAQLRAELARAVDALTQDYDTRLALKARIALDVLRLHEIPAKREGTDGR